MTVNWRVFHPLIRFLVFVKTLWVYFVSIKPKIRMNKQQYENQFSEIWRNFIRLRASLWISISVAKQTNKNTWRRQYYYYSTYNSFIVLNWNPEHISIKSVSPFDVIKPRTCSGFRKEGNKEHVLKCIFCILMNL